MKHLRKILAAALTLFVAVALATPAFAASITITRDSTYTEGEGTPRTYTAYKVFDADTTLKNGNNPAGTNSQSNKDPQYDPNGPIAYTMATNSLWKDAMLASGQIWFDVQLSADGSKYVVTPKKDSYSAEEELALATYLKNNVPSGLSGTTITPGTAATVNPGYYVILASDGATNVTVVTTDVKIVEKNTYLTTNKTTEETSYTVGQDISYTATVTIPTDANTNEPVIVHDEMASVLSFNNDVAATIDGAEFNGYTVVESPTDDCTFEINIPMSSALLGKTITFTYSAELTSAAVNPDTGFINKLYGEKNGYKTNPSEPKVYTFDFDFKKTFVGSNDADLTATFELCTTATGKKTVDNQEVSSAINLIAGDGAGKYIVADGDDTGSPTITSANNAAINVQGLAAGTYYLIEKSTSTGYNLLDGPATVIISDTSSETAISHTVTIDGKASTEASPATIENQSGTVLPSTGGIGTTIFYVVGGVMVAGAIIMLITKRRMASMEK